MYALFLQKRKKHKIIKVVLEMVLFILYWKLCHEKFWSELWQPMGHISLQSVLFGFKFLNVLNEVER